MPTSMARRNFAPAFWRRQSENLLVLGLRALNTVGEAHTRMANQHERDHANDYTQQAASGTPRHAPLQPVMN
ncbi:MAG: hypothetical protein H6936_13965 [Burkholderiales bacterium]|nr:hypothetical protein [Nitrosomonas sp.]MCP5275923.1 hypothetical protein [Burkholderiales bacterium]